MYDSLRWRFVRLVSALTALAFVGGDGNAQEDKIAGLILVPNTMKAYADHMPKTLPFVGKSLDCPGKVLVGAGLDAVKKEPDARFILQLHSFTHTPPKMMMMNGINRVEYSLYFRAADKMPTLLVKSSAELHLGNPKTDKTIFGTLAWAVRDDLAEVLAPKILTAKPAPYTRTLGSGLHAKGNAFAVTYKIDDKRKRHGTAEVKNRLPVKIAITKLAFVSEGFVTGKRPADPPTSFVEFKKWPSFAPTEAGQVVYAHGDEGDIIGPGDRYVRIVGLQLSEP